VPDRRATTLNIADALKELGITGGQQMEIEGPIRPVLVMSTASERFVAERVEPRGVVSADLAAASAGLHNEFTVLNAAPGGLIIETVAVNVPATSLTSPDLAPLNPAFAESSIGMFYRADGEGTGGSDVNKIAGANLNVMSVGSTPASEVFGGVGQPTGSTPRTIIFGTPFTSSAAWFVPAGVQLTIFGNAILTAPFTPPVPRLVVSLTFREIPAIAGST
jgi:hypothetical protein